MRSYNRFETDQEIACTISGSTDSGRLYNLSCGGCMIELSHPALAEGALVTVALSARTKVPGRVVWRVDGNAGVKFEAPLHQRTVQKFGYRPMEDFDRDDPRDRFGLPLMG